MGTATSHPMASLLAGLDDVQVVLHGTLHGIFESGYNYEQHLKSVSGTKKAWQSIVAHEGQKISPSF